MKSESFIQIHFVRVSLIPSAHCILRLQVRDLVPPPTKEFGELHECGISGCGLHSQCNPILAAVTLPMSLHQVLKDTSEIIVHAPYPGHNQMSMLLPPINHQSCNKTCMWGCCCNMQHGRKTDGHRAIRAGVTTRKPSVTDSMSLRS